MTRYDRGPALAPPSAMVRLGLLALWAVFCVGCGSSSEDKGALDAAQEETAGGEDFPSLPASGAPPVTPPPMTGERQVISLPEVVAKVCVGGNGRYLGLLLPMSKKFALFDVSALKVVGELPIDNGFKDFALGATKGVMYSELNQTLTRFDLQSLAIEASQKLQLNGSLDNLLLGSNSPGPAIAVCGDKRTRLPGNAYAVDLNTMQASPLLVTDTQMLYLGSGNHAWIAPNGRLVGMTKRDRFPSGLTVLVKDGSRLLGTYQHEEPAFVLPSPDGRHAFTNIGVYTDELKRIDPQLDPEAAFPAVHGPYYLSLKLPKQDREFGDELELTAPKSVDLKILGDHRSLAQITVTSGLGLPRVEADYEWTELSKRVFFIPDAQLIVHVPQDRKELVAVRFDPQAAAKASANKFLTVVSAPPERIEAGQSLRYTLRVESNVPAFHFALETAPQGMTLSPAGVLRWTPSSESPEKNQIVVSVQADDGPLAFHAFDLAVSGGAARETSVEKRGESLSDASAEAVEAPRTTPVSFVGDTLEVPLPEPVQEITVAATGRFLLLNLREQKRIAVFDVSESKIVRYWPAPDDNTVVVAGATRALVFGLNEYVVTRYRLDTLERERTAPIPIARVSQFIGMGSGSEGPVLLRTSMDYDETSRCGFEFMDSNSLKSLDAKFFRRDLDGVTSKPHRIHASTNGETFSVDQIGRFRLSAGQVNFRSNLRGRPSADGKSFLSVHLQHEADTRLPTEMIRAPRDHVPAVTGGYYLTVPFSKDIRGLPGPLTAVTLHALNHPEPLATIPDLIEAPSNRVGVAHRLYFIPEAQVIVTLPLSDKLLRLRKFNVDQALAASAKYKPFVDSVAPPKAHLGKRFEHTLSARSSGGGASFALVSGPPGMQVAGTGTITWDVPADWAEAEAKAVVSIRDPSGQEISHALSLEIRELTEKIDAEKAKAAAYQEELTARPESLQAHASSFQVPRVRGGQGPFPSAILQQPFQPRTWTDAQGANGFRATFVRIENQDTVILFSQKDGVQKRPLKSLSAKDIYAAVAAELRRRELEAWSSH